MKYKSFVLNRWAFLYYLVLLAVVFVLMRPNYNPPMAIRIGLLGLIFIPAVFYHMKLIPALFILFIVVDKTSFTHVLPTTHFYYLGLAFICYLIYSKKTKFLFFAVLAIFYFFIIALCYADVRDSFVFCLIAVFISSMVDDKNDISLMFIAFVCASLFLELLFFVNGEAFLQEYTDSGGMERVGWINPNVFGGAIAAGGVLAVAYLSGILKIHRTKLVTLMSIATAVLTSVVLALNASRGALFAFVIPSALMILTTKLKWYMKVLLLIAAGIIVYLIVTSYAFELMMLRLESETMSDAGGRSVVWEAKLNYFNNNTNFMEKLFGIGQSNTISLSQYHVSTHNDFITALIAYGVVGLLLFLYIIVILPITKSGKGDRLAISALLIYMIVECCVLEPIFRGYFVEIMFYFFILRYAMISKSEKCQKI